MDSDAILSVFLACYFGFVALHYTAVLTAYRMRSGVRRAEIGPLGTANAGHQIVFRVFRALILAVCVVRVPYPELDDWLLTFDLPGGVLLSWIGVVMMVAGLGVVDFAHAYLNDDWRSGLAGGAGERLITGGPYATTRNPIFIGILMGQAGFFLALPSAFTVLSLIIGVVVILRQVGLEERALADRFGDAYAGYRALVPRWIGVRWTAMHRVNRAPGR